MAPNTNDTMTPGAALEIAIKALEEALSRKESSLLCARTSGPDPFQSKGCGGESLEAMLQREIAKVDAAIAALEALRREQA